MLQVLLHVFGGAFEHLVLLFEELADGVLIELVERDVVYALDFGELGFLRVAGVVGVVPLVGF